MRKRKQKFKTNILYHLAEEHRKSVTSERDIERFDITDDLFQELYYMAKDNEPINMNINGPPGSGKSTLGMEIADDVLQHIWGREFSISDLDRDQHEFSVKIRNPDLHHTIRVIDEWNEMEETGENATVESALYNYFSDVMAQRWIHKISCSPSSEIDKNANIFIEVISTDRHKQETHAKVFYKLNNGGIPYKQLIGVISVPVGHIIQKPWYKEYRKRKFEKMDLILREGIFQPRKLEYAEVILATVERLKDLTKISALINSDIIRNFVKIECRRLKIPQSLIGEQLATSEVKGFLDLYKSNYRASKDVERLQNALKTTKETAGSKGFTDIEVRYTEALEMQAKLQEAIVLQRGELERFIEINRRYNIFTKEG